MNQKIRWNIPKGRTVIPRAMTSAGLNPLLCAMLYSRGIQTPEEAQSFISGDGDQDFFALKLDDIDKAAARIVLAAKQREKVAVFGDYDVDGITSTCLMTDFLREHMQLDCTAYIPDRIEEGYGLNCNAINNLAQQGITLIITVDCGITATQETLYARSLGVDMIITDHHECQDELPDAVAVVDPKRSPATSGGHALAGVGVAFKLACALSGDCDKVLDEYADLVAVGTIADVMPLAGENRAIVRAGLKKITENPRPGITALLREVGLNSKKIGATAIAFTLAPRLNAAGRLGCAGLSATLLMEPDRSAAERMAAELCELNRSRQAMEHEIWVQAQAMLKNHPSGRPIVLVSESWHQGVVGIVASRLAESHSLPTVMICLDGDKGKGSCRSYGGFNLFEALSACSEHLDSFGGHALAAGLNISREKVPDLENALAEYYHQNPLTELPSVDFDLRIDDPALLSTDCVSSLDLLEPCGNGNPRARLCIINAVLDSVTPMGGGRHLRLSVTKHAKRLECVYFSHTQQELGLRSGDLVDIAFYPQINDYRGRKSVQLILTDIRRADLLPLCARVLAGKEPEYGEEGDILPERRDFALLWRLLQRCGGVLTGTLPELLTAMGPTGLHPGKACAGLRILSEAKLISLERTGDVFSIMQTNIEGKADLNNAPYMRTLASSAKLGG